MHSPSCILHPRSCTLHPASCILYHASPHCGVQVRVLMWGRMQMRTPTEGCAVNSLAYGSTLPRMRAFGLNKYCATNPIVQSPSKPFGDARLCSVGHGYKLSSIGRLRTTVECRASDILPSAKQATTAASAGHRPAWHRCWQAGRGPMGEKGVLDRKF